MTNKAIWNRQHYLGLSGTYQRLIQNRNVWKRRKNTLLLGNSSRGLTYSQWRARPRVVASKWRANTALCHTKVRRGKQMASKHCSLSHCSSPWRADYSPWRVMTDFCRKVRFFTPKTQFSFTPIPNLIGNSTCDDSTTWTSIIHEFNEFSTILTTKFYPMT